MHLLHGHYHFGTRRASCRNDYCTHCCTATFTEGFRSFRVIHLFFVPLIPLGFFTAWRCTSCGKDPLSRRPMSRALALTGFVLGLLALAGVLVAPWGAEDLETRWGLTAVFAGLVGVTITSLMGKRRIEYLARRKAVEPLRIDECPYCHQPTFQRSTIRCEHCSVVIR